jgi:hypothetical protein
MTVPSQPEERSAPTSPGLAMAMDFGLREYRSHRRLRHVPIVHQGIRARSPCVSAETMLEARLLQQRDHLVCDAPPPALGYRGMKPRRPSARCRSRHSRTVTRLRLCGASARPQPSSAVGGRRPHPGVTLEADEARFRSA